MQKLSTRLRGQTPLFLATLIVLLVAGCAGTPPIVASPSACSELLPDSWAEGVEGVDWPGGDATAGDVWKALDRQTGQLDKANSRYVDGIGIVKRCEARDALSLKHARPKFLGVF